MSAPRRKSIRRNDLVRIGATGRKVYRVDISTSDRDGQLFRLEADANHPDAAKRVPDAFRCYRVDDLVRVSK